MKRLPLLLAALAALAGCAHRTPEPRFTQQRLDTLIRCGATSIRLDLDFAAIANRDESPALDAVEDAALHAFFGGEYADDFGDGARRLVARLHGEYDDAAPSAADELFHAATCKASARDTLVHYHIRTEGYMGGAHGYAFDTYLNFGKASGRQLLLSDLMHEEQLPDFVERLRGKLCAQYGVEDDEGLAQAGFFPEALRPTDNFEVTPEGLVFHYNPYDIGCYALGPVRVAFTREELGLK